MKQDKQQLIIWGVGLAILLSFGVFQYLPVLRQKQAIRERLTQQDLVAETICSESMLLPELKQQHRRLTAELEPFAQKVPQGRHFASLWQQIADVMNECKLTDQLVQPGEELKSDTLCSISLTVECRGTLEQLFAFFEAMEKMDRLIRFEKVKFESDSDFGKVVKLNATASVYYQPDTKENS